jgi:hypothetical protein
LLFDQVDHKQDRRAACAIQNWMTRSSYRHMLPRRFLQVPYFTHSALSPGLQSADLVAYLAAQQADPMFRPELGAWWDTFSELAMVFTLSGGGAVSTTRACSAPPAKPVDLPREGDRRVLHGL